MTLLIIPPLTDRSKIKCLTERPSCSSCLRRGISCVYETGNPSGLPQHPIQPSPSYGSSSVETIPTPPPTESGKPLAHQDFLPTTPSTSVDYPPTTGYSEVFENFETPPIEWNLDWIFGSRLEDEFSPVQFTGNYGRSFTLVANDEDQSGTTREFPPRDPNQSHLFGTPLGSNADRSGSQCRDQEPRDDTWPMTWRAVHVGISALPPLGTPGENYKAGLRYFTIPPIAESTVFSLQDSLSLYLARSPWKPVSLSGFPSQTKIDLCIDMYFKHFDWVSLHTLERCDPNQCG